MKVFRLPLLLLSAVALLTGCDSVTGPVSSMDEAYDASQRHPATVSAPTWGPRGVAVCHRTDQKEGGAVSYERIVVAPEEVKGHLLHGDERAGGAVLDLNCEPVVPSASCPCYAAADLAAPFGTAAPQPYVFFDVYNYYSEDVRRTEVRNALHTEDGLFEEVAAVYITSTGDPGAPLAPLCYRQDVTEGPITAEPTYTYETIGLTIAEAEACRTEIYSFAEAEESCQGSACGLPYTEEHLDPDFPPYHDDGFRTPAPVLDALRARIEAVRQRLALPA